MKSALSAALAALTLAAAAPALAQTPNELCPNGQLALVRTSKLKPGGDKAGFEKAVHDNLAWYRSKGITTNQQLAATVLISEDGGKTWKASSDTVASVHLNPPSSRPANDAAWDAFVAEFRANSDIATETMLCVEKPTQ